MNKYFSGVRVEIINIILEGKAAKELFAKTYGAEFDVTYALIRVFYRFDEKVMVGKCFIW